MDTLTHALSGALLARATEAAALRSDQLPRRTRMLVGFLAAAFPDGDIVMRLVDPLTYLTTHRGVTHSIVMLPLWSVLLGMTFAFLWRGRYPWRAFAGVCALGVGIHIAGDVITAFGTMIFAPLSSWRAQFPVTFIIDPVFSGIIVGGLIAAAVWKRARWPALAGLALLAGYVGFQATLRTQALAIGERYAAAMRLEAAEIEALPQPFSPFNWRIVVRAGDDYHLSYVNLVAAQAPAAVAADASWLTQARAAYHPPAAAVWKAVSRFGRRDERDPARDAWQSPALDRYRGFAEFPALYRIDRAGGRTCAWFEDLRFELAGRPMPFRYGACRPDGETSWKSFRLVEDGDDPARAVAL
jgi:inner membrane protein